MKVQNLSVKRLFGRVAIGLALSMSGITIALFLVTKQDRKSTRLNSSHIQKSRMPSSA